MAVQLQMRRGTTAEWTAADPTLANGEWGLDTTTSEYYIGNGTTAWTGLTAASLPSTAISTTVVDAVGDIFIGTADNTAGRLAVGTNDYVLTADSSVSNVGLAWKATGTPTTITVADTTDTTCFVGLWESATGDIGPKSDAGITYNAGTGALTATAFAGPLTGAVTGNASTATNSTTVTVADTTDTTCSVALFESATGSLGAKTDAGATYNAGTGVLTATGFSGPLTGNVTGNASGTALTVTQAAQTAITSVGTLTSLAVSGGIVAPIQIPTAKTASYTLVIGDAGKLIQMNVGSANNLTIPPNSSVDFDVGTQIIITQIGAGATTIVDGSGVTTNSKDNKAAIDGQYSSVSLLQTADDTWLVTGALA